MTSNPEIFQEFISASNLAISEINSAGGVLGKDLKLFVADNNGDPDISIVEANKMIDENKVVSLTLMYSSNFKSVVDNVLNTKDVLMISPTATSTEINITDNRNLVWRTAHSDYFEAKVAADYMKNSLNLSPFGVMTLGASISPLLAGVISRRTVADEQRSGQSSLQIL